MSDGLLFALTLTIVITVISALSGAVVGRGLTHVRQSYDAKDTAEINEALARARINDKLMLIGVVVIPVPIAFAVSWGEAAGLDAIRVLGFILMLLVVVPFPISAIYWMAKSRILNSLLQEHRTSS